ncbi:MAG: DUF5916 domain-containing protein [Vicinamibacterales bacterium]
MGDPRPVGVLALAVALAVVWPAPHATAQTTGEEILNSGRRTMTAERMRDGEHITLDGVLDEPVWGRATSAGEFVMQDPVLGGTPTEKTDIRIVYNSDHLYIGATLYDSEPDKLKGNTRKRDEFLGADDRFMWTMDTFLNQQTGYFFEMNPAGLMADALMGPGGSNAREWDGIWNARVVQSQIGWVIEIDIPFLTLAFDPNAPAWGINFQRTVRRKNEELLWTGHQRNQGLRRMATAGLLLGLKDIRQGRGWEVKPYASGNVSDAPGRVPAQDWRRGGGVGADVTYNFTPSLRGVASINTDFAETEVDQRLVNLTRFPLFLPERRSFFLDGATFFDFANRAFFSRRIGLDANGQPQRIDIGSKITGQAGRQDVGALYVRTGEDGGALGEDFLVLRTRRRILQQSYVGALYTGRSTRGQDALGTRHTVGIDARLATRTFFGNKNLDGSAFFLQATNASGLGSSRAFGGFVFYPNDIWEAGSGFTNVEPLFDPAVGFTSRRGFRQYNPFAFYMRRPPTRHPTIRRYGWGIATDLYTDMDNRWVTREVNVRLGRVELHSGDSVEVNVVPSYERLQAPFTISSGITLPAGRDYSFTRYSATFFTATQRLVSVRPRVEWGGFLSGHRRQMSFDVGIRPRPGVTLNVFNEWNNVDLAEGAFTTRLHRLIADTQFSPFMYLVNNVQYDSVSRVIGWQSRFRWIVTPGNDVFVVYTHNWVDDSLDPSSRFRTLDRRGAAKVVYTKRF